MSERHAWGSIQNKWPKGRAIYHAPKSMAEPRREALLVAWHNVAFEAKSLVDIANDNIADGVTGIRERGASRRLAKDARALIATFGVRNDRRRQAFPLQFNSQQVAAREARRQAFKTEGIAA